MVTNFVFVMNQLNLFLVKNVFDQQQYILFQKNSLISMFFNDNLATTNNLRSKLH